MTGGETKTKAGVEDYDSKLGAIILRVYII